MANFHAVIRPWLFGVGAFFVATLSIGGERMTLYNKYLEKLADKQLMEPFGDKGKDKKPKKKVEESTQYHATGTYDPTPLAEKVKY